MKSRLPRMRVRGIYRSNGPHFVWHIDGTHKAIQPYGIILHVGVDGFSRCCVYLACCDNNRSLTVLSAFRSGVAEYGLPRQARSDAGGENYKVGTYMFWHHGINSRALICGKSTSNQRVERMHRDLNECIIYKYRVRFE
jgi:hypothetical protein